MLSKKEVPVFIDPVSDFGFKRIFSHESNKDLLIAFLNELFRGKKTIVDLRYDKNELIGDTEDLGGGIGPHLYGERRGEVCSTVSRYSFLLEFQTACLVLWQ